MIVAPRHDPRHHTAAARRRRASVLRVAAAGVVVAFAAAACGSTSTGHDASAQTSTSPTPAPPLHVVSVTKDVTGTGAITVTFDHTLTASSPLPKISPTVTGTWARRGTSAVFTPTVALPPSTVLTIKAAKRTGGSYKTVAKRITPDGSVKRAEQILANLGYLPLKTTAITPTTAAAEAAAVYTPLAGHFDWKWKNTPVAITSQWSTTKYNIVLRGAIIAFQHQQNLTVDGLLGPDTFKALESAELAGKDDPDKYSYVSADLYTRPQTLSVWVNGKVVLTSPTNGGVAGAPTPLGTFPIYERLPVTTMSGTNPDGTTYHDPGVKWVNYFSGGSAIHGFPRKSYGTPQSVGCLELPIATAAKVYPMLNYGTLVTVSGPAELTSTVATPSAPTSTTKHHSH